MLQTTSPRRFRFKPGHKARITFYGATTHVPDFEFDLFQGGYSYRLKKEGRLRRATVQSRRGAQAATAQQLFSYPVRILEIRPLVIQEDAA